MLRWMTILISKPLCYSKGHTQFKRLSIHNSRPTWGFLHTPVFHSEKNTFRFLQCQMPYLRKYTHTHTHITLTTWYYHTSKPITTKQVSGNNKSKRKIIPNFHSQAKWSSHQFIPVHKNPLSAWSPLSVMLLVPDEQQALRTRGWIQRWAKPRRGSVQCRPKAEMWAAALGGMQAPQEGLFRISGTHGQWALPPLAFRALPSCTSLNAENSFEPWFPHSLLPRMRHN